MEELIKKLASNHIQMKVMSDDDTIYIYLFKHFGGIPKRKIYCFSLFGMDSCGAPIADQVSQAIDKFLEECQDEK